MLHELNTNAKVTGLKQSQRAVIEDKARHAFVAQDAQGMYRVIACSFATREEANEARYKITQQYPSSYIKDPWFLIQR